MIFTTPIPDLIGWLLRRAPWIALGIAAVIAIVIFMHRGRVIEQQRGRIAELEAAGLQMTQALDRQNKAVLALEQSARQRAAAAQDALAKARAADARHASTRAQIDGLLASPAAPAGCAAAVAEVRRGLIP